MNDMWNGNVNALPANSPVGRLVRGAPQLADPLSAEARRQGKELLQSRACRWCGGLHVRACPRVKKMIFHTDGATVLEVEFWAHGEWPDHLIVWPEDLETGDDE